MAGHHTYRTKLVRLIALFALVCLTIELVWRFRPLYLPRRDRVQTNLNPSPTTHRNRILGRWDAVRTSLGLTYLHAELNLISSSLSDRRASRFDLGSKRRAEETTRRLPPLHFAPDTRLTQLDETAPTRNDREKETSATERDANAVSSSVR